MFDIGADELLFTVVVAVIAIGPKELPRALRMVGRWVGKFRRLSNSVRAGIDAMVRDAEIQELERGWEAQRDEVLANHSEMEGRPRVPLEISAAESEQDELLTDPAVSTVPAPDVTATERSTQYQP